MPIRTVAFAFIFVYDYLCRNSRTLNRLSTGTQACGKSLALSIYCCVFLGNGGKAGNIKVRWREIKGTLVLKSCGGKGAPAANNGKGSKGNKVMVCCHRIYETKSSASIKAAGDYGMVANKF